jgi:hypothetical protein
MAAPAGPLHTVLFLPEGVARKATLPLLGLSPKNPFRDNFLLADHSATDETRKALFPTMSLHFASLAGSGRLCFGPVNYIEIGYEIVEGGQHGSGVWLETARFGSAPANLRTASIDSQSVRTTSSTVSSSV